MRPAILVLVTLLAAPPVRAEDARVTFLARQLKSAKDARVRAQTVLILGQTNSPDALAPLCDALRDAESVVRSAAAAGLAELKEPGGADCLKTALASADAETRTAIQKALASLAPAPAGGLYFYLESIQDKVGGLPDSLLALIDRLLRAQLSGLGGAFAPANEEKKAAAALIKSRGLRGFQLRVQVQPGATANGLKVEMLIMTYPDQSLKGSWTVKASGGKPEAQVKALVPQLVKEAARDLEWKQAGER